MQATRWKPKRGLAGLALQGLAACSPAPQSDPAEWISAERLARHVQELADDAYEGRNAGYAGEVRATQYIARRFESFGLEPAGDFVGNRHSWSQAFEFSPLRPPVAGETLHSRNVVALLHGTELADEIVVLGAHHDRVGRPGQADPGRRPASDESFAEDEIWNGASDNATSVAALLEIARAWKASGFHLSLSETDPAR